MLSSTAMSKQSDGVSPLPFLARFWHNPLVFFLCTYFHFSSTRSSESSFQPGRPAWGWGSFVCAVVSPTSRWVDNIKTIRTRRKLSHLSFLDSLLCTSCEFEWLTRYTEPNHVRPWYGGRDEPHGQGLPGWLYERHLLHPSFPGDIYSLIPLTSIWF